MQNQATVVAVDECDDSEGSPGANITVQFTDTHSQPHEISLGSCIAGSDYHEGQTIPLWYLPSDPEHVVTNGGEVGLVIGGGFLARSALLALLWLFVSFLSLIAAVRPSRKAVAP